MAVLTNFLNKILFPIIKPDFQKLEELLSKKTIIITGASYGIGESLCKLIANIDCHLILVARTKEKLEEIQITLSSQKATIQLYAADLRDVNQLDNFLNFIQSYHIDIFVNNAGISICRSIMQSLDRRHDYERTIKLNYLAPVSLCLALIPKLAQSHGQIINVSAINVLLAPTVNWAAYQASKTAFDQWLQCATPELRNQNIHVSTAYLPLVKTRMILPTKAYQNFPALTPVQAATIICRLLQTKKRQYKPWWIIIGQITSVLFSGIWLKLTTYYIKHKK